MQYVVFHIWLLSHSIRFFRFIDVISGITALYLMLLMHILLYKCKLFIQFSTNEHFSDCFSFKMIMSSIAMNIQTYTHVLISSGCTLKSKLAGSYGNFVYNF